nr:MAG TPA: hypothetical protein [Caudoviricetes sp.]
MPQARETPSKNEIRIISFLEGCVLRRKSGIQQLFRPLNQRRIIRTI